MRAPPAVPVWWGNLRWSLISGSRRSEYELNTSRPAVELRTVLLTSDFDPLLASVPPMVNVEVFDSGSVGPFSENEFQLPVSGHDLRLRPPACEVPI
jgi:hypothetical protein